MKFGHQQPSHTFSNVEGSSTSNIFKILRENATDCENLGYDSFWIMDHMIQIGLVGKPKEPIMESYTTLSALAACTSKIRLGALCTCNFFRSPALVAKIGATIDEISRGRFWLGMGAGWFEEEARMYGYDFPDDLTRLGMLEESLEIITKAWTNDSVTFRGKYYNVENLIIEPKPIQKPRPQILVGGGGEKVTLRLAAKYADACNLFPSGQLLIRKLEALKKHCDALGRDYSSILKTKLASVMFGESREGALRKLSEIKPEGISLESYSNSFLLGSTSNIVKQVEELRDLGIQYLIVNFRGRYDASSKVTFAKEIMRSF